jgi:hypothetical protein
VPSDGEPDQLEEAQQVGAGPGRIQLERPLDPPGRVHAARRVDA